MTEPKYSWSNRTSDWLGLAILLAGIAALGWLSGYYIGQTKYNVTVIAAIVTAMTAGFGATFGIFHVRQSNSTSLAMIGTIMLVYAITTYSGTIFGVYKTRTEELVQLFDGIELRAKFLRACAEAEARHDINGYREIFELPPLLDPALCK